MNIFGSLVLGVICVALAASIYVLGIVWGAWILTVLWAWFIVPFFHLPVLGIVHALGIMIVARFLTYSVSMSDQKIMNDLDTEGKLKKFGEYYLSSVFLLPLVFLVMGWIYHFFL
jgi:uncharacterized membrane protein